ncbi:hypothetical protein Y887_06475 [Xanthomonas pisi DSM 18956]|uniref:Uncharacterized protein n=1 Tax=Xanthomonas pisi TaxID=56457 RepID=A0A2S7D479_9XANT|nr:hypothetical protein Y887_06475 [Xanthomonas pisi DSM 18956]PPU68544.1 hypothetical protein XpiCFBP4643_08490 [Xanthomonas pisi]
MSFGRRRACGEGVPRAPNGQGIGQPECPDARQAGTAELESPTVLRGAPLTFIQLVRLFQHRQSAQADARGQRAAVICTSGSAPDCRDARSTLPRRIGPGPGAVAAIWSCVSLPRLRAWSRGFAQYRAGFLLHPHNTVLSHTNVRSLAQAFSAARYAAFAQHL